VLNGDVLSARSGVTGEEFGVANGKTITVPRLDLHEIVIVKRS
jgi:hypothetical protein